MSTKLCELFANRVVERRIMTMCIYGGELVLIVLGELILGGVLSLRFFCSICFDFELFLGLPFRVFC
jgi:hypothetical protein